MRNRCAADVADKQGRYKARGITVDPRWGRFENFLADMGEAPDGCELDRQDNTKGYSKSNCRWVTKTVNRRNTHRAKLITWQGQTKHYIEWAEQLGIKPETLRARVFRHNWPLDRAMQILHSRSASVSGADNRGAAGSNR